MYCDGFRKHRQRVLQRDTNIVILRWKFRRNESQPKFGNWAIDVFKEKYSVKCNFHQVILSQLIPISSRSMGGNGICLLVSSTRCQRHVHPKSWLTTCSRWERNPTSDTWHLRVKHLRHLELDSLAIKRSSSNFHKRPIEFRVCWPRWMKFLLPRYDPVIRGWDAVGESASLWAAIRRAD